MNFKDIPNKYRPAPFWSWNERLNTEETLRQIDIMDKAGIGGYFMHARGGLQTEYMSEEWFDNVSAAVSEGQKRGMYAWAYDENGWPSGFGNGIVNGLGVDYQQKYLRCEASEKHTDTTICNAGGYHFYYDVNPFYVDTLNPKATDVFLSEIYAPYYERYKNSIEGFFTDEPQISRNGIPWSFILRDEYRAAYGEDLYEHLPELLYKTGDYRNTRIKFWKLVTDLFSKNFMKKIYDWCNAHDLKLTGHLVLEENLNDQVTSNGAVMPHYEYFHIPGVDWLGRGMTNNLGAIQLGSVAQQLGKKQVLTESFALCGHNVSYSELKAILEWQMVRGINLLCPHLQGYSLRGIRKRDYPPAMYFQQPWWSEYKLFCDAMSRTGMLLCEGAPECDTLILHPQTAVWAAFDPEDGSEVDKIDRHLHDIIKTLDEKHIIFHLGDETIMERHARIDGASLIIGCMRYNKVIIADDTAMLDSTRRLLDEYIKNGGAIVTAGELTACDIIDNKNITYTKRILDGCTMHYFVNSTCEPQTACIRSGSKTLDAKTGELHDFDGCHTFEPLGSLIVIDDGSKRVSRTLPVTQPLDISGEWQICGMSENALTLDFCDYYFDGNLEEENGYVLNIQNRACKLERPVNIRQDYKVRLEYLPKQLWLVCETPEVFSISINGEAVKNPADGWYLDKSFRKIDIAEYVKTGENIITLECLFRQSAEIYENLKKALVFESEKNKITYDTEIEPIYLIGDFSVRTDSYFEQLDKNAVRYNGGFIIDAPKSSASLSNIEQQGMPFFCGEITFSRSFELERTDYRLEFERLGVNILKVEVNGSEFTLLWGADSIDISSALKVGKNNIRLTLTNNLRNLLGPHHLKVGETYYAAPSSFFKESCIWNGNAEKDWQDGYCFTEFGLK